METCKHMKEAHMEMVVVETYKYMVVEVTETEERRLVNI